MADGGLLGGIMNPAQADVLGAMDKGKKRQALEMAGEIMGQTQYGKLGALYRTDVELGDKVANALGIPKGATGRIDAMKGAYTLANQFAQAGDNETAAAVMDDYVSMIQGSSQGQEMAAIGQRGAAGLRNGDPETKQNLNAIVGSFSAKGEDFTLGKDQVRYDAKGNVIAGNEAPMSQIDKDFLKEERQIASSTNTALRKRASVISSSIGKIESLIPQIKNGSRAAAGGAIMSLARLISPGVVTDADFQAMSGAADPVATLMARLTEKGDTGKPLLEALQAAYDPTNPDLINADAILNIAKSVVGAEVPSILQEYKESDSRARRSGMDQRQYNTIFGDSESITGLSRYVSQSGKYQVEEL